MLNYQQLLCLSFIIHIIILSSQIQNVRGQQFLKQHLTQEYQTTDEQFERKYQRMLQNELPNKSIRITHDIQHIINNDEIPQIFKQNFENLINLVEFYFSNLIKTQRELENNKFVRFKDHSFDCMNIDVPENDKIIGIINSDLHIYYTVNNGGEMIALSVICSYSSQHQRPNFGLIELNQAYCNIGSSYNFTRIQQVMIHEIIHILGFNQNEILNWRDQNKLKYQYNILKKIILRQRLTTILMTPNVVQTARKYYNCSDIEGMQLENQVLEGQSDHWEASILLEDLMATPDQPNQIVSVFTIALLQDTGFWDEINENMASPIFWGKHKGCSFFNSVCYQSKKEVEFFDNFEIGCDFTGQSKGVSQTSDFTDDCYIVGSQVKGNCQDDNNMINNYYLQEDQFELYSDQSKCFVSNIYKNDSSIADKKFNDVCYRYTCSKSKDRIIIEISKIDEEILVCNLIDQGEYISSKNNLGKILCPSDFERFCTNKQCKNYCSTKGICIKGKCHCLPGFIGEDCSVQSGGYLEDGEIVERCAENTYIQPDYTCKRKCPNSYFPNQITQKCEQCDFSCSICKGPSQNDCLGCQYLSYLFQYQCLTICPIGFYGDNISQICQECDIGCLICENKFICQECQQGYLMAGQSCYINHSVEECTKAIPGCKICANQQSSCIECNQGYYLDKQSNQCVDQTYKCPRGTYGDIQKKECLLCSKGCLLCYGKDICLECDSSQGYRLSSYKICVLCKYPCFICENQISKRDKCLSCEDSKFLLNQTCIDRCPEGYQLAFDRIQSIFVCINNT